MRTPLCHMLSIESPIEAFSHYRDVAAALARAGGPGALGATCNPADPDRELSEFITGFAVAAGRVSATLAEQ